MGASAAQALVLLRIFPERQPGFGFGTAAEGDKRPTRVPGCWLRATHLPPPLGCTRPSGLGGGPGREIPAGSGTGTPARAEKGLCGQSQSTTGKPKCLSTPRLTPHRPWVTRYRCVRQKTHGEVTLKCRFLTLPESRGEKNPSRSRASALPGRRVPFRQAVGRGSNFLATAFSAEGNKKYIFPVLFCIQYCGASTLQMSWVGFALFVSHHSCSREPFCKRNPEGENRSPLPWQSGHSGLRRPRAALTRPACLSESPAPEGLLAAADNCNTAFARFAAVVVG